MTHSIRIIYLLALLSLTSPSSPAQTISLQEMGSRLADGSLPKITIYQAREVLTLDPAKPRAEAVAVVGSRILATGTLDELKAAVGDQEFRVDETFKEKVIVPGFIS